MSELDADKLAYLQDTWNNFDVEVNRHALHELDRIRHGLEEMGLDLAQDATYELIDADLTKEKFDHLYSYASVTEILDYYHRGASRADYINTRHTSRVAYLSELIERRIPLLEKDLKITGIPKELDELPKRELKFILDAYHDGTLEDDMRSHALPAAHDYYRLALSLKKQVEEQDPDDLTFDTEKNGLFYAEMGLEMCETARHYYKAGKIPAKYGSFGGWDKEAGEIDFSRAELMKLRTFFLLNELSTIFKSALKFQNEGHYVLDFSGGGYGMNGMPVQDVAEKLVQYGYRLSDPKTFEAIDTDIETFRSAYQKERTEVAKSDHHKLIKPEFSI